MTWGPTFTGFSWVEPRLWYSLKVPHMIPLSGQGWAQLLEATLRSPPGVTIRCYKSFVIPSSSRWVLTGEDPVVRAEGTLTSTLTGAQEVLSRAWNTFICHWHRRASARRSWCPASRTGILCPLAVTAFPPVWSLTTMNLLSVSMDLLLHFVQIESCTQWLGIWLLCLASCTEWSAFKARPCCSRHQYFVPFYGWILFHRTDRPQFIYPFICWSTHGLFPLFGRRD